MRLRMIFYHCWRGSFCYSWHMQIMMAHHAATGSSEGHKGTECYKAHEINYSVVMGHSLLKVLYQVYSTGLLVDSLTDGIPWNKSVYLKWTGKSPGDITPMEMVKEGKYNGQCGSTLLVGALDPWPIQSNLTAAFHHQLWRDSECQMWKLISIAALTKHSFRADYLTHRGSKKRWLLHSTFC